MGLGSGVGDVGLRLGAAGRFVPVDTPAELNWVRMGGDDKPAALGNVEGDPAQSLRQQFVRLYGVDGCLKCPEGMVTEF